MMTKTRLALSLALLPTLLAACGGGGGASGAGARAGATTGGPGTSGTSVSMAYALNSDHTLSWYETGSNGWTPAGYLMTDTAASGLVPNPQGSALYVLENGAGGFRTYTTTANGLTDQGFISVSQPQAAVTDPAGRTLYVAGANAISVFPIQNNGTVSGLAQTVTTGSSTVRAFAFSADSGTLYTATGGTLQAWSVAGDGSLQPLGSPVSISATPVALAVDPQARQLYIADTTAGTLRLVPLTNGIPSAPTQTISLPGIVSVSAASDGQTVYAVASDGVHILQATTGALSPTMPPQPLAAGGTPVAATLNAAAHEIDVAASSDVVSRWAIGNAGALSALPTVRSRIAPIALVLAAHARSTTPAYVFASNSLTDTVYGFTTSQGALIPGNSLPSGMDPENLATDPTHQLLYVADAGGGTTAGDISTYRWDSSAALSTAASPVMTSSNPVALALEPSDRYLYAVDLNGGLLYTFSTSASGSLTPVTNVAAGTGPQAVAVDPTGQFLYVADKDAAQISIFQIDPATGVPAAAGSISVTADPYALAFDPSGNDLYVTSLGSLASSSATTSAGSVTAFQINPATGALTTVGTYATGPTPKSVAVTANTVYVVDSGSDQISQYARDPFAGTLTAGATTTTTTYPHQLAVDDSGTFGVLSGNTSGLLVPYAIDAAGTLNAGTAVSIGNGAYAVRVLDQAQ